MLRSLETGLGHLPEGRVDSFLSVGSSLFEGSARHIPSGWMLCVCISSSCSSFAGLAGPRTDQHQAHLQGLRDYDRLNWCGEGKRCHRKDGVGSGFQVGRHSILGAVRMSIKGYTSL